MEAITKAIIAGAAAGKLRKYLRRNGTDGLAGLTRLADRQSAAATAALRDAMASMDIGETARARTASPRPEGRTRA